MEVKRGRGRPPTGKTVVKVRLSKADLETCLRHGATAQEGITNILGDRSRRDKGDDAMEAFMSGGIPFYALPDDTPLPPDRGIISSEIRPDKIAEPVVHPAPVRWFCNAKKCYTHPVNYGDFCSDCRAPRPA